MINKLFYKILLNKSVRILFASLSKRRKLQYIMLIFLFFIQSAAELLSIGSVIPFITAISRPNLLLENVQKYQFLKNNIYLQTESQLLIVSFVLFLFLIISAAIIRVFALYMNYRISIMSGYEISKSIFEKILYQEISYFYKNDSSQITSFIANKVYLCSSCLMHYFGMLNNIILISIVFTALIIFDPIFTISVFLFFLASYISIILFFRKRVKANSFNIAKIDTSLIKLLREAIQNIKIMIIHKIQDYYLNIFSNIKLLRDKSFISNLTISSIPKILMETIAIILLSSVAFVVIFYSNNDFLSILPYFAIIVLAGQRLLPIFQQLYFAYTALLADSEAVMEVTNFFIDKKNEIQKNHTFEKIKFEKLIIFENVSFYYDAKKFKIENLNLNIEKGKKIGIVGSSGSGKTTFIDLLMGLIKPKQGNIKIDNTTLDKTNIPKWHEIISHIPQNTYLNNDTISKNIAYGIDENQIDKKLISKIIKQLKLQDLINLMDQGYDTNLGEAGNNISGGQRQKIAFARSFYRNFEVLIIDEGTSSMDNISEENIFNQLDDFKDKTIFIVSHRLAFIKNCDFILEFNNGKIVNKGTYEELLDKSETFRELSKNVK